MSRMGGRAARRRTRYAVGLAGVVSLLVGLAGRGAAHDQMASWKPQWERTRAERARGRDCGDPKSPTRPPRRSHIDALIEGRLYLAYAKSLAATAEKERFVVGDSTDQRVARLTAHYLVRAFKRTEKMARQSTKNHGLAGPADAVLGELAQLAAELGFGKVEGRWQQRAGASAVSSDTAAGQSSTLRSYEGHLGLSDPSAR